MSAPISGFSWLTDRHIALVAVPATLVVVLRRRARRKAGNQAWRYRTHHEASADSARMVSTHQQESMDATLEKRRRQQS